MSWRVDEVSVRCVVDGVMHHFRHMSKKIMEGHRAGGKTFQGGERHSTRLHLKPYLDTRLFVTGAAGDTLPLQEHKQA